MSGSIVTRYALVSSVAQRGRRLQQAGACGRRDAGNVAKRDISGTAGAVCDRASFPRPSETLDLLEKRAVTDRAYSWTETSWPAFALKRILQRKLEYAGITHGRDLTE